MAGKMTKRMEWKERKRKGKRGDKRVVAGTAPPHPARFPAAVPVQAQALPSFSPPFSPTHPLQDSRISRGSLSAIHTVEGEPGGSSASQRERQQGVDSGELPNRGKYRGTNHQSSISLSSSLFLGLNPRPLCPFPLPRVS